MEENQVKENQVKNLRKQINKTKKVAAMLCMAVMLIGLTGCKKEDPEPEKVEESIVIEFDESIPNVLKMTSREQVMSLSVDEFEKSIRQYMPQWRDWYKIPSDYAVTQDDWKSFQYLYCEMVFGPETDDTFISAPEKFATLVADIDVEEECPSCFGTGKIRPSILFTDQLEGKIDRLVNKIGIRKFYLHVHPYVAAYINQGLVSLKRKWQMKYGFGVHVIPSQKLAFLQYEFYDSKGEPIDMREEIETK